MREGSFLLFLIDTGHDPSLDKDSGERITDSHEVFQGRWGNLRHWERPFLAFWLEVEWSLRSEWKHYWSEEEPWSSVLGILLRWRRLIEEKMLNSWKAIAANHSGRWEGRTLRIGPEQCWEVDAWQVILRIIVHTSLALLHWWYLHVLRTIAALRNRIPSRQSHGQFRFETRRVQRRMPGVVHGGRFLPWSLLCWCQ